MGSDILFLTGAPLSSGLEWETANLLQGFLNPHARFTKTRVSPLGGISDRGFSATASGDISWRALNLHRQHLTISQSRLYGLVNEHRGNVSFFNIAATGSSSDGALGCQKSGNGTRSSESPEEVLSKFYEHSFAIHTDVAPSQVAAPDSTQSSRLNPGGTCDSSTSFDNTPSSISLMPPPIGLPVLAGCQLSDLDDIPNAKYLLSIHPQTMTVNLIVGIITISQPRGIKTRHGVDVELVEVLVGDETKSGFEITCWLPSSTNQKSLQPLTGDFRDTLANLRPQDIILMRNVQLSSFRGKVHGQTLRKDMTKVQLLYRNRIDRKDRGGCYNMDDLEAKTQDEQPEMAKTRRVKDWALRFVGIDPSVLKATRKGESKIMAEALPPDTQ